MSTQRFMSRLCKGPGRFTFAMLLGALLALPCLLPAAVFARAGGQAGAQSPTLPLSVLNKVGVSVMRLVATYGTTNNSVTCTGLGVLVASQDATGATSGYENWVLTDGNLVSTRVSDCGKQGNNLSLSDLQIWASNEYTGGSTILLGHLTCSTPGVAIACSDALSSSLPDPIITPTPTSYTLLAFHSAAGEPYVGLLSGSSEANVMWNVGLTQLSGTVYPTKDTNGKSTSTANIKDYLTPHEVVDPPALPNNGPSSQGTLSMTNAIEGGTPEINSQGQLVGIWVNNGNGGYTTLPAAMLQTVLSADSSAHTPTSIASAQACSVASCWNSGIDAFYQVPASQASYTQAHTDLSKAATLNPQFIAAQKFAAQAQQYLPAAQQRASVSGPKAAVSDLFEPWQLLAAAAVVVVLLLLIMVLLLRTQRRRRELAQFDAEVVESRRIAAEQAAQRAQQPASPASPVSCPNCHNPVQLTDTKCPYCRFPLSPSASGMGVRLAGNAPVVSSPLSPVPSSLISEQPTVLFPPSPPPAPPAEFSEPTTKRKQAPVHEEATQAIQQLRGRNLSLAVGTRSDPGIKRKHKPNEDSLFAMQGARTHNSQPQQFGLFVVADGMGGHANGQDASRLAIQTMIDFMLPKVSTSEQMDDEAFLKLMGDGVQNSNLAVYNRNLESHADMGTTMTAALVIGAIAYVANVGDSRTYLYREGQGLSKVTHDHSVVASLVEAGIIKPDDIYTHPKRNQIYRSLGEKQVVEVDTFRVDLLPGDKLMLCSDGLWDMVRDPLIQDVLGKTTGDPNETGQNLIKAALNGGGEDNVSVIVVQFAETNEHTGMTGVQLLAKPETVTIPKLPQL
jgi:serine/threonine protein phosphatase PrpC